MRELAGVAEALAAQHLRLGGSPAKSILRLALSQSHLESTLDPVQPTLEPTRADANSAPNTGVLPA
jgi:hypothetical protein